MATSTRWQVVEYAVRQYGIGRYGLNDAAQSDKTTLSDDSQFGGRRGADRIATGCDISVRQNSAADQSGTLSYDQGRVSSRPSYGAGTITMDPAPSGIAETPHPSNNYTEFLVLYQPFRFEDLHHAINQALAELAWEKRIVPVTFVRDGDMLKSGTSDWTAGGSASLTKVSGGIEYGGLRVMGVTGSGSGHYAQQASPLGVVPGDAYYIEALAFQAPTAGVDGTVSLRDSASAAELIAFDVANREPEVFQGIVTIPSGTEVAVVRLQKDDNASIQTCLFTNVILRRNDLKRFPVADRPNKVLWLGEMRGTREMTYHGRSWPLMTQIAAEATQVEAGQFVYHIQDDVGGVSLWYEEIIQPAPMDSDDDTTSILKEDLAAVVTELMLRPHQGDREWGPVYAKVAQSAGEVRMRYMAALKRLVRRGQVIVSPAYV